MNTSETPSGIRKHIPTLIRLSRWGIFGLACLFTLVALYCTIENWRGKRALEAWKKEMRAKGEKLTLEELGLAKPTQQGEGAKALLQAMDRLAALSTNCVLASSSISTMKLVAPGKAKILLKQNALPEPISRKGDGTIAPHEWTDLADQIARAKEPLEQVRSALQQSSLDVGGLDYSKHCGMLLLHLSKIRNTARWLSAGVINDLHEGKLDKVVDDIRDIGLLDNFAGDDQTLIHQLVRIAIRSINMGVVWEALQVDGWRDEQLRQLQNIWQRDDLMADVIRSFEVDRVVGSLTFEDARRPSIKDYLSFSEAEEDLHISFLDVLLWRWAWSYQDELYYLQHMQRSIEAIRPIPKTKSQADAYLILTSPVQTLVPRRFILSKLLLPALGQAIHAAIRSETQCELTVTAIALKRYQLRTGKLPSNLDALIPEFLPALPIDYMDGKPLRYRPNADGTFVLYSVGGDGKDDGGDPNPVKAGKRVLSFFWSWENAHDVVWPMPATPEEVVAYEASTKKK